MATNLNFIDTLTVEQFKAEMAVSRIVVKENPNSGKLFCIYGARTGAVSSKGLPQKPMLSLVHPTLTRMPNEEEKQHIGKTVTINDRRVADPLANGFFWMLHEESEGAPVKATY